NHSTSGRWMINQEDEVQQTLRRPRPPQYGPEVQHALFLAWHAANRICAKRLIPFLPTLIEALERHEHLHLTEECRRQLLSMSAATSSGSCSAVPPAATNRYKSAPFSVGCGKSEPICCKPLRSNG